MKKNSKEWKELLEKIESIRGGEKGVVWVLDKTGWSDISTGVRPSQLLPAINDWQEFVEKETKSIFIRILPKKWYQFWRN